MNTSGERPRQFRRTALYLAVREALLLHLITWRAERHRLDNNQGRAPDASTRTGKED